MGTEILVIIENYVDVFRQIQILHVYRTFRAANEFISKFIPNTYISPSSYLHIVFEFLRNNIFNPLQRPFYNALKKGVKTQKVFLCNQT